MRESATYSMLQAGAEFDRWRRGRGTPTGTDDGQPRVHVERVGAATEVTLSRPERHNALDTRARDELHAALAEATTGPDPVVLLGAGPSFCSGGDLDEFGTFPDPAAAHLVRLTRSIAAVAAAATDRLVVGLHGAVPRRGYRAARRSPATSSPPTTRASASPSSVWGWCRAPAGRCRSRRAIGRHRAFALLALDGTISASAARAWGLVDEVVPRARLRSRCLEIAESLS